MKRTIALSGNSLEYSLRRSGRAKRLVLRVNPDGACVVTIPRRVSDESVEKFLIKHSTWIFQKIEYFKTFEGNYWLKGSEKEFSECKERAQIIANDRVKYFASLYGFTYKKITIRNQKTRWGSCSKRGNLSFHYKIALLPPHIADYIIVHEVCHLGEFNHSVKFWDLVSKTIPEYARIRKEICK